MAKLIYSMLTSVDGYIEDAEGRFGWGFPEDEEVHGYFNDLSRRVGTYLHGRKVYELMAYWETAEEEPNQPEVALEFARLWKGADKIVFSRTLRSPRSARTRIERGLDFEMIRRLKAESPRDLCVDGPNLAAQFLKAGLVDEIHLAICPVVVGGGKRFFPDDLQLRLEPMHEHRFRNGVVALEYAARA